MIRIVKDQPNAPSAAWGLTCETNPDLPKTYTLDVAMKNPPQLVFSQKKEIIVDNNGVSKEKMIAQLNNTKIVRFLNARAESKKEFANLVRQSDDKKSKAAKYVAFERLIIL